MKMKPCWIMALGIGSLGVLAAQAGDPPAPAASDAQPSAIITPNGLMSLFGKPQVLFKVTVPAKPGELPQVLSFVMSEGDEADGVAVTRIDLPGHRITFDNHGQLQTIPLAEVSGGGGGEPAPGLPMPPGLSPADGRPPARAANPGPSEAAGDGVAVNPMGPPMPGAAALAPAPVEVAALNPGASAMPPLSVEAQAILIEARRHQLEQQGDPTASLIPPTPFSRPELETETTLAGEPGPMVANP